MNKVVIFGGLGNQMFQFALAIVMDSIGKPTKISVNDYILHEHYQGFELIKAFDIPICFDDRFRVIYVSKFLRPLLVHSKLNWFKKFAKNIFRFSDNIYYEKDEFCFDQKIYELDNYYLIGGWKSTLYFDSHKSLIQEVFNFKKPIDDVNLSVSRKIQSCNSVAVHIRRGNYSDPSQNQNRVLLDATDYYKNAFQYINEHVTNPVFYIFSDDPEWVRKNIKGDNVFYISHNTGPNSYLDMYLMSICKHFIIANSSFSWWPAWLSKSEEKIVVSPDTWEAKCPNRTVYPEGWKVVPVSSQDIEFIEV
ncbi:alpha-1,2-fucosyltransferase [Algoriphagus halophilus]|uniref:alpha-1,2-fucosyltransferase n=1 Tax=Algoriphagus halophilus TaxID=226505 RepID=UPI00359016E2